ncbi:MAG: FAD-dependent oxidoreductase [Rubrobacteraceae bacterium]|nr:FAD-dependent oxidoreductase [Rubrobacteraceae bacterium]
MRIVRSALSIVYISVMVISMPDSRRNKRLVFAGGGHAHLYSLARTGKLVRRGFDVTLVDRSPYLYYSGMATGVISGVYAPDEHRIDLRRLVEEGGGKFVEGRITEIRAKSKELVLETGEEIRYDAASFCLGSEIPWDGLAEDETGVVRVKPIENTNEIRRRLLAFDGDRAPRVLVVGGGAAGCEVAANTLALLDRLGLEGDLTVVHEGESLLPSAPKRARAQILRSLRERGAKVLASTLVTHLGDGVARTDNGREIPYDLSVLSVGVSPPGVFRASGLPTGDNGGLWVDRHLRSIGDERLFGGGDCVSFRGEALPKLGVFAVRQGPVIFRNLQAVLRHEPLEEYRPQKRFLYVLNLGDGDGLAVYGPFAWRGKLAWKLKNRIDEKFVEEYR